jgi:drug/metabolite transporter (DMT)-like permease
MQTTTTSTNESLAVPRLTALMANGRLLTTLALLTLYIIWGTTYLAIRYALESFPPYLMMGLRFTMAGGALFTFMRLRGAPLPTFKQWRSAALVGTLLLVGGMGSVAMAEQWISSGLAATMVATVPLWVLGFGMIWGKAPTRTEWIGVGLGLLGVAILSLEGNLQANPQGVLLIVFATMCWSLGSVWMSHLDMPPGAMGNAAEMLSGGIILLVAGLVRGEQIDTPLTTNAVLALAYLTTFGSLATITAYMFLLKTVPASLATSYTFVNPVVALLLGVVVGGEVISGSVLIALPVILLAIAFVLRGKRSAH